MGSGRAFGAINYLLIAGGLTGLNKIPEVEEQLLEDAGLDRKLRPVNSGACLLKAPMRCVLADKSSVRVGEEIKPWQLGYGTALGPQVKIAIARALYAAGYFISLQDAINAFNALCRQAMLDAVDEIWPEATRIFNKIYGVAAPVFYVHEGSDGTTQIRVTRSEQGARMGCVIGGFAFNVAMHVHVYRKMHDVFPTLFFRVLTDDKTDFGRPKAAEGPATEPTGEEWQAQYRMLADSLRVYDTLANPINIFRHNGKGILVLPPNAPDPSSDSGLLELTTCTRGAARVAGGHVGAHEGMVEMGCKLARTIITKIQAIGRFGLTNAQAAVKILKYSSKALEYYYGVTPTTISKTVVAMVQGALQRTIDSVLTPEDLRAPRMHVVRHTRAHTIMSLTSRMGGGHYGTEHPGRVRSAPGPNGGGDVRLSQEGHQDRLRPLLRTVWGQDEE